MLTPLWKEGNTELSPLALFDCHTQVETQVAGFGKHLTYLCHK